MAFLARQRVSETRGCSGVVRSGTWENSSGSGGGARARGEAGSRHGTGQGDLWAASGWSVPRMQQLQRGRHQKESKGLGGLDAGFGAWLVSSSRAGGTSSVICKRGCGQTPPVILRACVVSAAPRMPACRCAETTRQGGKRPGAEAPAPAACVNSGSAT